VHRRACSRVLGISHQTVSKWPVCPVRRVLEIERLTKVSRGELRSDIYPAPKRRPAPIAHHRREQVLKVVVTSSHSICFHNLANFFTVTRQTPNGHRRQLWR
jgi:hypothetical protein